MFTAPQAARADGPPAGPSAAELATSGLLTRSGADLATAVEQLGTTTYSSIYGGLIEVNNGRTFDVYLTKLDPAAEAAFQAIAPDGTLEFLSARRTAAQLDAVHQRLADADADLAARGIMLTRFWPDISTGTEHVGVLGLNAAAATALSGIVAAADLTTFNATLADIPHTRTTRQNDSSPFNGGDAVGILADEQGCTSGFGIRVSGTTFLLTAGHCFLLNETVHNMQCTSIPCTTLTGSNIAMGAVTHRASIANQMDTEYMNARGSRLVFTGTRTATSTVIVAGTATSPQGAQVCDSGSYSGEHCGAVIDSFTNGCLMVFVEIDNQVETYCHLVHATLASHGILSEGGDSGGPVFRFSGSNALAVGTITAGSAADSVTCTYLPANSCSWDVYYTNISNILSLWGATIVTT